MHAVSSQEAEMPLQDTGGGQATRSFNELYTPRAILEVTGCLWGGLPRYRGQSRCWCWVWCAASYPNVKLTQSPRTAAVFGPEHPHSGTGGWDAGMPANTSAHRLPLCYKNALKFQVLIKSLQPVSKDLAVNTSTRLTAWSLVSWTE